MRGWYDIKAMAFDRDEDRQGLEDSATIVRSLIEQENQRGIDSDHIFLAGFSQGGAVALFTGLRFDQRLAGIIALSTYLADAANTAAETSPQNRAVPIFLAHGTDDAVIPLSLAERSRTILAKLDYSVSWRIYKMPHSVSGEEIKDIAEFIAEIVL